MINFDFLILLTEYIKITSNKSETESVTNKFLVTPATIYPITETPATVQAYGICVDTWSIWLHLAPVEDNIIVSDIGEQWSPNTEPDNVAESAIAVISGATL